MIFTASLCPYILSALPKKGPGTNGEREREEIEGNNGQRVLDIFALY